MNESKKMLVRNLRIGFVAHLVLIDDMSVPYNVKWVTDMKVQTTNDEQPTKTIKPCDIAIQHLELLLSVVYSFFVVSLFVVILASRCCCFFSQFFFFLSFFDLLPVLPVFNLSILNTLILYLCCIHVYSDLGFLLFYFFLF